MMHTRSTFPSRQLLVACALGACMASPALHAAGTGTAQTDIEARYQLDVQRCNSGQTNQDKATCLQEAGAARGEAQKQRLVNGNPSYEQNQTQRCNGLPTGEREDCLLQMSGQNTATQSTTTQGSVGGGGVLRETTITMPGSPTTSPSPTTAPAATPMPTIPAPGANTTPIPGTQ